MMSNLSSLNIIDLLSKILSSDRNLAEQLASHHRV